MKAARMARKGPPKLPFRVGRFGLLFQNEKMKKKKSAVKKEKPFVGFIPPACLQSILNIRHLEALEIAKKEAMDYMGIQA